ncbi:MAG: tetratricopeptide repeat protein [Thermoplasmatales archaeon]|nr:tetratricopeptide repeat protein [Thermoplasmatales archaeon]
MTVTSEVRGWPYELKHGKCDICYTCKGCPGYREPKVYTPPTREDTRPTYKEPSGPTERREKKRIRERNKFWLKGNKFYNNSDWDKAIRYYQKALHYDTLNSRIITNLKYAKAYKAIQKGNEYFDRKDWDNAIKFYEIARNLVPKDEYLLDYISLAQAKKFYDIGKQYYSHEDWDNAIKYYKEASDYRPNDLFFSHAVADAEARKLNSIGKSYFESSNWDSAVEHFRRASKLYPFAPYLRQNLKAALGNQLYELGSYYLHDGDWIDAIWSFEHALEFWPDDTEILADLKRARLEQNLEMGQKYFSRGDWDMAIAFFKKAEKGNPYNKDIKDYIKRAIEKKAALARIDPFEKEAKRLMDETLSNLELHEYSLIEKALKNPNWLPDQRQIIIKAIEQDEKYTEELLVAINTLRYSEPLHRPKALSELIPGDILLMEPEGAVGHMLAVADQLSRGRFLETGETEEPASHAVMFYKRDESGTMWFLDHRAKEGSRLIDKELFTKRYSHRKIDVARPRRNIEGKKIWKAVTSVIKKSKEGSIGGSDFGFFGNNLVCSERMGLIIVKIADLKISKRPLNPVTITPGDFYDPDEIGKYFVVTPLIQ